MECVQRLWQTKKAFPCAKTSRVLISSVRIIDRDRTTNMGDFMRERRSVFGRAVAVVGVAVFTLTGGLVTAAPASAKDYGVSVAAYCRRADNTGVAAYYLEAVNINGKWDGWRCRKLTGLLNVDMQRACNQQGGGKAVVVEPSANGWRCRR